MAFDTQELTDIALSNMRKAGETVKVTRVRGDENLKRHLANIGFVDGSEVHVVSSSSSNIIVMVKGARDEAKSLYGEVREEFALGKPGAASRRYVQLIGQTSTACLMPYYQALCPAIFSEEG